MDDKLAGILIAWCTFGLFGLVLIYGGIKIIFSNRKFTRNALTADGVVMAIKTSTDDKGSVMYSQVVEFVDKEDRKIHFTSNIYESESTYAEGDHVEVFYDKDFERMELAENFAGGQGRLLPLILVIFGSLFLVLPLGITLMSIH